MLVVMQAQATEEQVRAVCQKIESLGYRAHSIPGAQRTAIGITGNKGEIDQGALDVLNLSLAPVDIHQLRLFGAELR